MLFYKTFLHLHRKPIETSIFQLYLFSETPINKGKINVYWEKTVRWQEKIIGVYVKMKGRHVKTRCKYEKMAGKYEKVRGKHVKMVGKHVEMRGKRFSSGFHRNQGIFLFYTI